MFLAIKSAVASVFGFIATSIAELLGEVPMLDIDFGITFDAIFAAIKTALGI